MVNRSGQIGTAGETGVVRYLAANGFPNAERRRLRGTLDGGDIITVPDLAIEVKAGQAAKEASLEVISDWLGETEAERANAGSRFGILVVQRRGYAPARAGFWRAIVPVWAWLGILGHDMVSSQVADRPVEMHLRDLVTALREAGYGDRLEEAS